MVDEIKKEAKEFLNEMTTPKEKKSELIVRKINHKQNKRYLVTMPGKMMREIGHQDGDAILFEIIDGDLILKYVRKNGTNKK